MLAGESYTRETKYDWQTGLNNVSNNVTVTILDSSMFLFFCCSSIIDGVRMSHTLVVAFARNMYMYNERLALVHCYRVEYNYHIFCFHHHHHQHHYHHYQQQQSHVNLCDASDHVYPQTGHAAGWSGQRNGTLNPLDLRMGIHLSWGWASKKQKFPLNVNPTVSCKKGGGGVKSGSPGIHVISI